MPRWATENILTISSIITLSGIYFPVSECGPIKFDGSGVKGHWSQWSAWSACTLTSICGSGTKTRQRQCLFNNVTVCTGSYIELQSCPDVNCKNSLPLVYTDIAEAAASSFISQECNTDVKYSVASKHAKKIPQAALAHLKYKLLHFLNGFFNVEYLVEKPDIGLNNMTKVCFEPNGLKLDDLPSIYRFNRIVKASLSFGGKLSIDSDVIAGLVIVTEDKSGTVEGIYYALKSPDFGYETVGYRRWRGQGVLDTL